MVIERFSQHFTTYLGQIRSAREKHQHHDYRRALFLDFISKSFGIENQEIDIEKNVKGTTFVGNIDALFRDIIFEFKRDFNAEKEKGVEELTKYLKTLPFGKSYFAILTDGTTFETFNFADEKLRSIEKIDFEKLSPTDAFLWLDSFLFSEKNLPPTSHDIVHRFGVKSPVFISASKVLGELYNKHKQNSTIKIKFSEWDRLLSKVYGSSVASSELFIKHTYLTALSKLIAYISLFKVRPKSKSEMIGILSGESFRNEGFSNLVEHDFFTWIISTDLQDDCYDLLSGLVKHLNVYDLTKINEDLLKELYQGLVDPETRHDLGEFYTPDWLAEYTLAESGYQKGMKILDPSCGSGTFLFSAIRSLMKNGLKGSALITEAKTNIIGVDIHPVAVTIARVNYLLALSSEWEGYGEAVNVPVFMADSLVSQNEVTFSGDIPTVFVDRNDGSGKKDVFTIPFAHIDKPDELDKIVDEMRLYADKDPDSDIGFQNYLEQQGQGKVSWNWINNLTLMRKLVNEGRDSIWSFILKNFSRPIFFSKQSFDLIVGNPPWLAYRDIKDPEYQKQIKKLVNYYGLLDGKDVKLFNGMDTSTLFFILCADQYLKPAGKVSFVMPRSVMTGAKQHVKFQKLLSNELLAGDQSTRTHLLLTEYIDLKNVSPLFNVPSCVLIAEKTVVKTLPAIRVKTIGGRLPTKNEVWEMAKSALTITNTDKAVDELFLPSTIPSNYLKRIKQGATIVPRFMWFVQPRTSGTGIINQAKPALVTDNSIDDAAKVPWKGLAIKGTVESKYLYSSLLATFLVPFGITKLSLVVLPVESYQGQLKMVTSKQVLLSGDSGASEWFTQAEGLWIDKRKASSPETIQERLNYSSLLTSQHPKGFFNVLYNTSGTNLSACVIDTNESVNYKIGSIQTQGFIADAKTYVFQAETSDEAHYLCAILNSAYVNLVIKPYQTVGTFGARDIHRRPFEVLTIPNFDQNKEAHLKLAELSEKCHKKIAGLANLGTKTTANARGTARVTVSDELGEIENIVVGLFNGERV